MTTRSHVAITIGCGLAVIAAAVLVILVQVPDQVISSNQVAGGRELAFFHEHTTVCQGDERLPARTVALRVSLAAVAHVAPAVSVAASHEGRILAGGHRNAGWVGVSLTLPLQPAVPAPTDAKICLTRGPAGMPVELLGNVAPANRAATVNGNPLSGRMRVEYLTRGHQSWLALAKHVARRIGLLHEPSGTWIVVPLAALMSIAIALACWLLMREQRYE